MSALPPILKDLLNRKDSQGINNPLSPPSDPVQRRLQSPPTKSNFLAVEKTSPGGVTQVHFLIFREGIESALQSKGISLIVLEK